MMTAILTTETQRTQSPMSANMSLNDRHAFFIVIAADPAIVFQLGCLGHGLLA